ncbi:uncharacterized protein LOC109878241 isoform X2 [Oncorhynchus kisutch]|uniref:uncharacterized protein LOC109878241 isoform X2 n=1 Tax=Oncorhynchus kisutch TaxID=8019 RepID=UPI0012DCD690|nr:uncharacterized protein LOC109878241 isoform X2 [Oncorhynchus kisutch]XP_031676019.1 uncharacterized protein LOC109878241 isoform X2 [Oncorhynchus kisutch]
MALRTAGSVLVVFLWSVTVVLGQDGWSVTYTTQSICTLKGSTVDLFCSYTYPSGTVTTTFWFTKMEAGIEPEDLGQDPEYAGRLEYHGDKKKDCTLKITDLRERDSATYKFRLITDQEGGKYSGSPGVTLSVTGLQVKVTGGHQDKTLTCSTTCTLTDNPTYIWYKNGQHLDESTSPQYKDPVSSNYEDSYSCAVEGHEDLHSPAVCVQGQSCNRVTYTKRRICVLKGSTVDISCTYVGYYYATSSFWFRSDKSTPEDLTTDPGYAGRVEYTGTYRGPFTLRITDLREEDSAEYRFTFKANNIEWGHSFPGTSLSVTGLQVKVTPAAEGQKTLTCITTCTLTDNPTYIWYKNGQRLDESTSPQYKDSVSSNYGDSYSCAVNGHDNLHSPAVCVVGESCMNVTYTHQSICALKGSTVDISCFYTHPSWYNVTEVSWFNKWESGVTKDLSLNPEYVDRVENHRQTEKDSTLRITDLRESDSTEYKFRFTTDKARWGYSFPGTSLTVTGSQVEVTPKWRSEYKTLSCSTTCTLTDNPIYIWYKNGQHLDESTSPQYKDPVSSNYEDSYSCAVKGHEDLLSPAVCVQGQSCNRVTYTKRRICVLKGSTVDISCTYVGYYSTTSSFWFRSDKSTPEDLTTDPGYAGRVEYTGTYRDPFTLRITDLREEDSAEFRFTFKTNNIDWGHSFPGTSLSVTGLQVKVTPAAEGQKTLTCITTCTLTDNPTYIWYKNGQRLDEPTSQQYSSNILVVLGHSADSYSCAVEHHEDLHSPAVCVQGQSCNRVTYTKRRICVLKGSTVDISCTYVGYYYATSSFWFRSDKSTPEDLTTDPGYAGRVEYTGTYRGPFTLRITDLREEDSAEYRFTFKANNIEWGHSFPGTSLSVTGLQVKVTPAAEGQKTLTCITTCTLTDNPTYIWYKNGQRLDESTSPQYKDSVSSNYGDSYSCAVNGHDNLHSPAVCVVGESCMNVTYTHQSICALKGSTVDISCFYTHPSWYNVTEVSWFNKWESGVTKDLSLNPEYVDRVENHRQTEKDSTLRITDLRESDSTEYKFRFTTDKARWGYSFPGTSLTVTGSQVEVTPKWRSEYKTLSCSTTCTLTDNPIYIWYKNGQHLDESTSPQYKDPVSSNYEDSYSCAVKGHEDLLSPAVCVQGQSCNRVTYTKRRICVLKGSTVDISCTYVGYYSTTSSFWFRSDKSTPEDLTTDPGYAGRVEYTGTYRDPFTLRITDLREEDSAEFRFTFKTNNIDWGHSFPGTSLSVTGLQVKVTPAAEGQKTLTCITTCTLTDNPTYIWYKNGQRLDEPTSQQYSSNTLVVLGHSADSYSCAVEHHEDLHSPAVCVQGQSCNRVTYTKRRICVLKGSTVDISCTYVGYYYATSSFWFRSDKSTPEDLTTDPGYAGRVEYTGTYRGPFTLRITDLREEDSAEYRFTFKANNIEWGHSFPGTTLSVTGLQVKVTPAAEGQKTLTCSTTCTLTDNPTYIWYKNGQRLDEPTSQQYSSNTLVVLGHSVDSYSCTVEHHEDLHSPAVWKQTSVLTAAVGIIVVVLVLILCLSGLMWFRKNASKPTNTRDTADVGQGDTSPVFDNVSNMAMNSTAAQTADTDIQDDVHYASVHFSRPKNQELSLYSTVQVPQPQKEDEDVPYAAVKFNLPIAATRHAAAQAAEEDSCVLYSTVNKP